MPRNQAPPPEPGAPARILVVDDDPLVIRLIIDTLNVEGYDVDSAENGVAALEKIRHAHFDLIFLTGSVGSSDLHRFLKEAGLPLLRKPFNLAELQQIVRQALASP